MKTKSFVPLLVLPLALSTAYAQESGTPSVRVSGFGTAAVTWTDTNDAQFVRRNQPSGVGTKPRPGVDSDLGLQVDVQVNDWLSLTGQGLVRKDLEDDYGADATLAFAKFKLSDEFSVRVGRIPLASFMISDYRYVGYANTMLRPSQEAYSQSPALSQDGVEVMWQHDFDGTAVTGQLGLARLTSKVVGGIVGRITGNKSLNLVVERGPFTARFGRDDGTLAVDIPSMNLSLPKSKVSFTAAGLAMDWHNIVAQTEYTKVRGFSPSNGWYVMGGYRFGKVLPFYSHGKLTGATAQASDSVGLRWDAFRSADIKVQFDRVRPQGGQGLFVNAKPGFHGPVTVGAVALDFVF